MNRRKFLKNLLIAPCALLIPKIAQYDNEFEIDGIKWNESNYNWIAKLDEWMECYNLFYGNPHSTNEFDGISNLIGFDEYYLKNTISYEERQIIKKLIQCDWNIKPDPYAKRIEEILAQYDCEFTIRKDSV